MKYVHIEVKYNIHVVVIGEYRVRSISRSSHLSLSLIYMVDSSSLWSS